MNAFKTPKKLAEWVSANLFAAKPLKKKKPHEFSCLHMLTPNSIGLGLKFTFRYKQKKLLLTIVSRRAGRLMRRLSNDLLIMQFEKQECFKIDALGIDNWIILTILRAARPLRKHYLKQIKFVDQQTTNKLKKRLAKIRYF